jgi:hypothetical protein
MAWTLTSHRFTATAFTLKRFLLNRTVELEQQDSCFSFACPLCQSWATFHESMMVIDHYNQISLPSYNPICNSGHRWNILLGRGRYQHNA